MQPLLLWEGNECYILCVCVCGFNYLTERMRRFTLSSVACLAVQYFSTLSPRRHDLKKNLIEHKMCVLIFSTIFLRNFSRSK